MDPSFAAPDGYVLYGGWNKDSYVGMAIQKDGKIVVSTGITHNDDTDVGVLRYDFDGNLDEAFGNDGRVNYDGGRGNDNGRRLALQGSDRIVVAGNTFNGNDYDALVLRYALDGAVDPAFGDAGAAVIRLSDDNDWVRRWPFSPVKKSLLPVAWTGRRTMS